MNGLTVTQISQLKRRLQQEHAALRQEVADELRRSGEGRYQELAGRVHDSGEEAVADLLADLEIAELDRHVTRLRQLETALGAIKRGSYGLCQVCGNPIGLLRLEVDAAVERCIVCQTEFEKGHHAPTL